MRFTRGDYAFFGAAGFIIVVFSLLFYFDFTTRSAVGQERVVGSIIFKKQVAQRKYSSQVVWEDVEKRTPVYNNDSIRTSGESEAVIRLNDGTEITLNENSMILLAMDMNAIDIQFKGGAISAKRDEAKGGELGALNIRSGESTVSVQNTDLQVSSVSGKDVSVTVSRGRATVTSGDAKQDVKESQKAVIEAGSTEIRMTEVALIPLSPGPDAIFVTPERAATVRFAWGPLKAGLGGLLEVSAGGAFTALSAAKKLEGAATEMRLPPGTYYWRMKARGGAGGEMIVSDVRKFTILREAPAHQVFPSDGQVFQHTGKSPIINFKWNGSETVQVYRLDIGPDPSMGTVQASFDTQGSSIAVDTLGPGTFYWRVTSIIRAGGETYRIRGNIRSLLVEKGRTVSPPHPVFPQNGEVLSRAIVRGKGIVFSWDRMDDVPSFKLAISRSENFSAPVYSGATSSNFLNFRSELAPGTYYWRVTGIISGTMRSGPSNTMHFTVIEGGRIRLRSPLNNIQLIPEQDKEMRFSWENVDVFGEYVLQIASDTRFRSLVKEQRVNDSFAYAAGLGPGSYHWRVLLKNAEGDVLLESERFAFVIQNVLPDPVILSPRPGAVYDFKNIHELDLSWKRLRDADLYRIRFYRMENNRAVFIAEREIGNTPLEIDDINFLGEGKILWSIQAFETSNSGKILRTSGISRSYFEVRIPQEQKKIKFLTPKILYTE